MKEKLQLFLKSLAKEAVDERVQAAVGEGCQPDGVPRQRVVLPERPALRVASQEVDADEDVLREPADEEHQHSRRDHSQGSLPARLLLKL